MLNDLSLTERGDDDEFIGAVANSLFADGTTNWGRIVSLAAFGAALCRYLKEKGLDDRADRVGEELSAYLMTDQKRWLVENNSWVGWTAKR